MAGIYMFKRPAAQETAAGVVSRMVDIFRHRGPIENGFHTSDNVALGMARLSIIDVEGGQQPIYNETGTIAVVFNGQIYNYVELRAELQAKGHQFRTGSDTEILVHLYEEEGPEMLRRLNGMFAVALHDLRNKSLLIARDRLGVKPLYYSRDRNRLIFASELKSLLIDSAIDRTLCPGAIAEYLTLMYVRAPNTPFAEIKKLRPGHYLLVTENGITERQWWKAEPENNFGLSYEAACERLLEILEDSVRLRLRSDVPVGSLLSGGVDSSAITAIAARHLDQPLNTFTVGFADSDFDELPYAKAVAEAYGTNHVVQTVRMEDAIELLPHLVWHLDEPNADNAIIPTYMISRLAASKVRVVLCGVGGDELFGGYARYFEGRRLEHLYRRLPAGLRNAILSPLLGCVNETLGYRAQLNALDQPERFLWQSSAFSPDLGRLLSRRPDVMVNFTAEYADTKWADPVNRLLMIDLKAYLTDDILHLTDRMSMANSLEIREPLLDHRLVSFALGLPSNFKISQADRAWKRCFKDAVSPFLPPQIVSRQKWGFGGPVSKWMNNGVERIVRRLYENSSAVEQGLLDCAAVQTYFDCPPAHDAFQRSNRLWSLLILELWVRIFVDGRGEKPSIRLQELAG